MDVIREEAKGQKIQRAEDGAERAERRSQRRSEMNERLAQMEMEYRDILEETEEDEETPLEEIATVKMCPFVYAFYIILITNYCNDT